MNKKEILSNLKADLKAAKDMRNHLDTKITSWKNEYNAEPYGNEREGRSKLISRDIKKQSEWQHSTLVEPFISTNDIIVANPVTFEDKEYARKVGLLLNTQFCRQFNRYNFMNRAIRVLDMEGTCVIRTGWEYEEKEIEEEVYEEQPNPEFIQLVQIAQEAQASGNAEALEQIQAQLQQIPQTTQVKKIQKVKKPVVNKPTAVVCRNEDIFIDPTCSDNFDNAQFIIHRYETDITALKRSGNYRNLDQIQITDISDEDYNSPDKTEFKFKDKPRKKLLVYEYWGNYDINGDGETEPIVAAWVNDVLIRLEDNPFPDKKPPFIVTPFNVLPFTLYGESNAELLSDVQKIKTAIYRGFIDNMAMSNNGQKGIRKGALDHYNRARFDNGDNFEFNGSPADFYDGHFNELPGSVFNILQLMNNEAESITGVKAFYQGMNGNALGGTATGIQGILDSASSRKLNIVRNIAENLVKPLLRKWLAYDSEWLDEESQIRITNEEFIWIKKDDLSANIDIDLSISTSDDNKSTASELAFLLQTIGPSEDPTIRRLLMADICDLYRRPELAKKIREYAPEPDPMAQQMQQLQIQMLQAQVANETAKAGENEIDQGLKAAKIETEKAKARNISSIADKTDLDYLQQYSGVKEQRNREHQMEMSRLQKQFDIDKETLKLINNSINTRNI